MRINILLIIVTACCFLGCKQKAKDNSAEVITTAENTSNEIDSEVELKNESTTTDEARLQLRFNEFELVIDNLEIWDEEAELKAVQKDSAIVYLELGATIEGRKIKIEQLEKGTIKIYQRFENSVTVMNEGPHCDLTEWKHYYSEWKQLQIQDDQFLTDSYSERDREKFIEVDMDELREAVRKQCGDRWAEHIKNVKSPHEYPCGIGTSRIVLKIEYTKQEKDSPIEKTVAFKIPMGC